MSPAYRVECGLVLLHELLGRRQASVALNPVFCTNYRHVMIEHGFVNGKIYVVPGWGERTQWYRNIAPDPHVTVQRRGETFAAKAVPISDESELTAIFQHFRNTSPMFKPFLNSWRIEDNLQDFLSSHDRQQILVAVALLRASLGYSQTQASTIAH